MGKSKYHKKASAMVLFGLKQILNNNAGTTTALLLLCVICEQDQQLTKPSSGQVVRWRKDYFTIQNTY